MTKTLLTFGDSNTHGTPPITTRGVYERFDAATRWPTLTAAALGPDWSLVEEGLPGRTICFDDPVMGDHMNGWPAFRMALQSHGPLDVVTIMLGTNDVKTRFGATPEAIMGGLAGLVDIAQSEEMQTRHGGFKILLICPPPIKEVGPIAAEFWGATDKSNQLPALFQSLATRRDCGFLDAGKHIETSDTDGIHYEPQVHTTLAKAVTNAIQNL